MFTHLPSVNKSSLRYIPLPLNGNCESYVMMTIPWHSNTLCLMCKLLMTVLSQFLHESVTSVYCTIKTSRTPIIVGLDVKIQLVNMQLVNIQLVLVEA